MTKVEHLLARVGACGYGVSLGADGPTLLPQRPEAFCPPKLLAELKAGRAEIVDYLRRRRDEAAPTACPLCSCDWYCPAEEIPALAASPHWCGRTGAKEKRGKSGAVAILAAQPCPFLVGAAT